ncbi:hypothetical protein SAMN05216298_4974 [Glycomyces sambucus]|uniref:Uncharacterized protein n=1 Tax=Glycomyces sambucus TaxID=380244 RepID=A0A1G9MHL0_9ACTN|nr:hypothetical protein [Glycomyces sambucus]SDL73614.1 hypothetical protein SAMN05216298_4974 [Glycomyces sambucus]
MSDIAFTVPELNLLLSLVHLHGAGDTHAFKTAFGYDKVESNMREPLVEKGLVTVDKTVRPFRYELTDAGWRAARPALTEPAQTGLSKRTARIIWAVLRDVATHMGRTGIELADVYAGQPVEEVEPETLGDRVLSAYRELCGERPDWVPLLALRKRLGGEDRSEVDKSLVELHAAREIELIPESNRGMLTDEDRDAAIWLGGEHRHLIRIGER